MWHLRVKDFLTIVTMDAHGQQPARLVSESTGAALAQLNADPPCAFATIRNESGQVLSCREQPEKAGVGGSIRSLATFIH